MSKSGKARYVPFINYQLIDIGTVTPLEWLSVCSTEPQDAPSFQLCLSKLGFGSKESRIAADTLPRSPALDG
jgi:hypothetical protein